MQLTKSQSKHLKSLAHHLKPVVHVGQRGVSDAVITELESALDHHELVKIKIAGSDQAARLLAIAELCKKTNATEIQQIGTVAVLFRRNNKKPVIVLPG